VPLIRLHWDFHGPDALPTAEHFLRHLDQFCAAEGINGYRHWVRENPPRCTAILECDEAHLILVRDRLRPVRGERVLDPE
jgi:hypothetical protein